MPGFTTCCPPGDFVLEAYPLLGPPEPVPLSFQPRGASREAVLARHAREHPRVIANSARVVDGNPTLYSPGDGQPTTAAVKPSPTHPPRLNGINAY